MQATFSIDAFQSSPELLEQIRKIVTIRKYEAHQIILDEDAAINAIPIVLHGSLKVIRTEDDGREILLYYIKPGESCIMSFLGGMHQEKSVVRAEVEEAAEIVFIPIEQVSFFIKSYPEFLDYIFKLYHQRFEELLDIINAIAFKKVDDRLLDLLYKKHDMTDGDTLSITHEQLANELGTARVVISRLLKQLENKGIIQLGRNKITIL